MAREQDVRDRFRGCLLGLAVGDAVGTTVEFQPRGSFPPVSDMVGGGPFGLKPGQWTDDTSMALCLAESLADTRVFDPTDQLRRYVRWYREGHRSSTGECFDIGTTTSLALQQFERTGTVRSTITHSSWAGNGCIMRLAPVPMFAYPDLNLADRHAAESARTTHGAQECEDAARLLARMLIRALDGESKEAILFDRASPTPAFSPPVAAIAQGMYADKSESGIYSGGYVVHCLEAAAWCFLHTQSFREAILRAVNLGHDADTTAAVCGQLAGAYYGLSGIPPTWARKIHLYQDILTLADQLLPDTTPAPPG